MPMDAWRKGDSFVVEFDLPGVNPDSVDIDVERNVVTVKAERPGRIRLTQSQTRLDADVLCANPDRAAPRRSARRPAPAPRT
jgi:Hsp20/alpha crystallin family protein